MGSALRPYEHPFQFTHPGKGATRPALTTAGQARSFNSRTLGRVRPPRPLPRHPLASVSIHAPWEGCDTNLIETIKVGKFQFTHPGKGATNLYCLATPLVMQFQFTHPGKGATTFYCRTTYTMVGFNSRTLGRVRLLGYAPRYAEYKFQFTHPGKGATSSHPSFTYLEDVSIHAPWEGCDSVVQSCVL